MILANEKREVSEGTGGKVGDHETEMSEGTVENR
jgi:hypothetical protein